MPTKTASKPKTKKPKWTVVSYKKIEARRAELGLSKSAMAAALEVTNSTYHNWRRGTTVPHPNQQEEIAKKMAALTPKGDAPVKKKAGASKGRPKRGQNSPGAQSKRSGHVSGGTHAQTTEDALSHPLFPNHSTYAPGGVGAITSAWISSQGGKVSAGSVFEFVRGLKGVLRE